MNLCQPDGHLQPNGISSSLHLGSVLDYVLIISSSPSLTSRVSKIGRPDQQGLGSADKSSEQLFQHPIQTALLFATTLTVYQLIFMDEKRKERMALIGWNVDTWQGVFFNIIF